MPMVQPQQRRHDLAALDDLLEADLSWELWNWSGKKVSGLDLNSECDESEHFSAANCAKSRKHETRKLYVYLLAAAALHLGDFLASLLITTGHVD